MGVENAGMLWSAAEYGNQVRLQSDPIVLASLIAASWNPLMERLKAIGSLRDLVDWCPNRHALAPEILQE